MVIAAAPRDVRAGDCRAARLDVDEALAAELRRRAAAGGAVLWHADRSISAVGVAARLALPLGLTGGAVGGVQDELAAIAIENDDLGRSGPLPLALGALAFDPGAPGQLVVPEATLVETDHGPPTLVVVAAAGEALETAVRRWTSLVGTSGRAGEAGPERFELGSARPHEHYRDLVRAAVADIRSGELDKVVLVREVVAEGDRPFQPAELLERLRSLYPSCMTFSLEGFVGASPELLVSRSGARVRSHPLAGTIARSGDPATDARAEASLLASAKERAEHRFVVEAITAALAPICNELDVPTAPSIVELRNVAHLGSNLSGLLEPTNGLLTGALDLVARLHPTPAVAGAPTGAALEWIARHEDLDRGPYGGPVGWVDASGDGEWFVGIRAAIVEGNRARLFAGSGIVAGSDPDAELAETQLKLQALLAAAIRP
jgi:menaquinone-specific isochorismate synthase